MPLFFMFLFGGRLAGLILVGYLSIELGFHVIVICYKYTFNQSISAAFELNVTNV